MTASGDAIGVAAVPDSLGAPRGVKNVTQQFLFCVFMQKI